MNEKYGAENWRLIHKFNGKNLSFAEACQVYGRGYFVDSFRRKDLWRKLAGEAREVYDYEESNIQSGFDYTVQESSATHLQDIAIRIAVFERGWKFEGNELVQIRSHKSFWGRSLSPGKVLFHAPNMIINPHLSGWWETDTIEDFWQSNKYLQKRIF